MPKKSTAAEGVATVTVRVLALGAYGQPNDVVEIPADELAGAKAAEQVDDALEAVAYAASLPQNQPPADPAQE